LPQTRDLRALNQPRSTFSPEIHELAHSARPSDDGQIRNHWNFRLDPSRDTRRVHVARVSLPGRGATPLTKGAKRQRMWRGGLLALPVLGLFGCTMLTGAADLAVGPAGSGQNQSDVTASTSAVRPVPPGVAPASPAPTTGRTSPPLMPPPSEDASATIDAAPPPPPPPPDNPVECGATTCHGANAACCVGDQGNSKTCVDKGGACFGAVVECGGRANCGQGEVCCLSLSNGLGGATCTAESACGGAPSGGQMILCRSAADCLANQHCVATTGSFSDHMGCI
jgi:hypothetical protein